MLRPTSVASASVLGTLHMPLMCHPQMQSGLKEGDLERRTGNPRDAWCNLGGEGTSQGSALLVPLVSTQALPHPGLQQVPSALCWVHFCTVGPEQATEGMTAWGWHDLHHVHS